MNLYEGEIVSESEHAGAARERLLRYGDQWLGLRDAELALETVDRR